MNNLNPKRLTKQQAAIISAYTGYLAGSFSDLHEYAQSVLGRPIWTHQFPEIMDELRDASRDDFMSLVYKENDQ